MDSEKKICGLCEEEIKEGEPSHILGDDTVVCDKCFREECKQCEECEEYFPEGDMEHAEYNDKYYCESCFENLFSECGLCGRMVLYDDMEFFGDDLRICPDCFAEEFPHVDVAANEEETTPAYEAMKKRLIGLKVEDMADETYEYDSEMDEDGYRYTFTVDIDKDGRICDVSRLSKERCQNVWTTGESWHPCKIYPDDYDEDGFVEDTIRCVLDIAEDEDLDEEDPMEDGEEE